MALIDATRAEQQALNERIVELIETSESICICAHTFPDGDAIGSTLGMARIIRALWPNKETTCLLADNDKISNAYTFLPGTDTYIHASSYSGKPDLFLCLDLAQANRLEHAEKLLKRAKHVAVIDHHPADEPLGEVHLQRTDAAAVGVLIFEFAEQLGFEFDPDTALCLLCAITTDTGSFQFQNADVEAFECASRLVAAGADPSLVSLNVFQSTPLNLMQLEARVISRIETFYDGKLAYSYATWDEIVELGISKQELGELIDVVRRVEGSQVALFLRETSIGKIRGNLRSKSDIDISGVARALEGGGHKAASGFSYPGTLEEVRDKTIAMLGQLLGCGTDEVSAQ